MFKNTFFFIILVFSFVTSCRSSRQVVQKDDKQTQTTKEHSVTYKDTTLFTTASEVSLKVPFNAMNFKDYLKTNESFFVPKTYSQTNGNVTAKIRIERDTIWVYAKCDSLAIRAQIKQELIKETTVSKENNSIEDVRTKGVSVFKLILYIVLAFILGFGTAYLLKTFKIL